MDGNSGNYTVEEGGTFRSNIEYLCREIDCSYDHISTIVQIIKFAVQKNPEVHPLVPGYEDKRFVFTRRVRRDGIYVPSLRVLIKIHPEDRRVELLALTSIDVRL
jgi:hypothetical protein